LGGAEVCTLAGLYCGRETKEKDTFRQEETKRFNARALKNNNPIGGWLRIRTKLLPEKKK